MISTASRALPAALALACGAFFTATAQAIEPANWQWGPVFFTPTLGLEEFYTDNLWLTNDNEKDTWASVFTPKLQAWLQNGPSTSSLTQKIAKGVYHSSSDDDYTDYTTNLDLHQEFNARNVGNLFGEYYKGHEDRGTGFIEGNLSFLTDKPVKYDRTTAGGDYTYGSRESAGRVKLAAQTADYHYRNFRNYTRYRDRDENTFAGTFYWKVAPRTDALLETRLINNDYDQPEPRIINNAGSLSSDEMNYLLGVEWEATAMTAGHLKLGYYDRDYNSSKRQDKDGFLWEVGVTWAPRSYSVFDLNTRRYYQETTGLGNGINTEEYKADWRHEWSDRSRTKLGLVYSVEKYEGATRKDDTYGAEARYDYAFRRWLDLGAGYRWEDNDSDINSYSYTENLFFLEAKLSL